ncbi:replication factor A protein 1 [Tanacetum coccineum]
MRLCDPTLVDSDAEQLRLFTNWLLDMGDGRLPAIALDGEDEASWITILDDLLLPISDNPIDTIMAYTFPDLLNRLHDINYLKERCILCSTNDVVDGINSHVLEKFMGSFMSYTVLTEGRVYQISKFKVLSYRRMLFRQLSREVYVQFSRYTRVVPSYIPLEAFPRFLFKFVEYENLKDRYNDDKYLTDVIGILTEWGPLMEKTENNAFVNSIVRNVVIRDLRAKEFKCKPLLTMSSSSHFLLDLDLKENDPYVLSPMVPVVFTRINKNRLVVIHILDLFEKLMASVELDSTFILDANVVGVDLVNDWKFVQYKLVLKVGNGCHVMDCVFFNQYARNLLGVSVDDLINKALTLGVGNPYWIEDYFVMNLYGERVVIEIKVDKFNLPLKCSRRFTVVKYFGDHPDYIHHSDIIPMTPKPNGACVNVSEAILPNVADVVDQHMQDDYIHVLLVTNDVDQDIVHDTSHVVAKPNDSHIVADHIRDIISLVAADNVADVIGQQKFQHGEDVPCHKDKSHCIPIKDSVNNSAGSLTDLSEVTDDQGAAVVDKLVLNENIDVVASKNDSIDGVVDNSVIDADNAKAEYIDIVSEGKDEVGSNDILNEVADEVVSDDIVSEAAANVEDMDVDDVGYESEIGVSAHSYSDADEDLERILCSFFKI